MTAFETKVCIALRQLRMDRHRIDERDSQLKAERKEIERKIGECGDGTPKKRKDLCERLHDIDVERKGLREDRKYTDIQVYSTIGEADQGKMFDGDVQPSAAPVLALREGVTRETLIVELGIAESIQRVLLDAGYHTVANLEDRKIGHGGARGRLTAIKGINAASEHAINEALYGDSTIEDNS